MEPTALSRTRLAVIPVEAMQSTDVSSGKASAAAMSSADVGSLGAYADASALGSAPGGSSGTGTVLTLLRVNDLVFSGPGQEVETSLNLVLEGSLAVQASVGSVESQAVATANVAVNGLICALSGPPASHGGIAALAALGLGTRFSRATSTRVAVE